MKHDADRDIRDDSFKVGKFWPTHTHTHMLGAEVLREGECRIQNG